MNKSNTRWVVAVFAAAVFQQVAVAADPPLRRVGPPDFRPIPEILEEARKNAPAHALFKLDPGVGSYFYNVALNRKCGAPNAQRADALDRLKREYFAARRAEVDRMVRGKTAAVSHQQLDDLERDGPPEEILAIFDDHLSDFTPAQLAELCRNAPTQMEERIATERQMGGGGYAPARAR